MQPFT